MKTSHQLGSGHWPCWQTFDFDFDFAICIFLSTGIIKVSSTVRKLNNTQENNHVITTDKTNLQQFPILMWGLYWYHHHSHNSITGVEYLEESAVSSSSQFLLWWIFCLQDMFDHPLQLLKLLVEWELADVVIVLLGDNHQLRLLQAVM